MWGMSVLILTLIRPEPLSSCSITNFTQQIGRGIGGIGQFVIRVDACKHFVCRFCLRGKRIYSVPNMRCFLATPWSKLRFAFAQSLARALAATQKGNMEDQGSCRWHVRNTYFHRHISDDIKRWCDSGRQSESTLTQVLKRWRTWLGRSCDIWRYIGFL